ncbi:MAG: hypothetical protein CM1200mP41_00390 [Gammaproteobacteria bacterium]|nr:MAG: hypothetical protein CM1200mP41_00390 [Gammaproteobacteria bacterium]
MTVLEKCVAFFRSEVLAAQAISTVYEYEEILTDDIQALSITRVVIVLFVQILGRCQCDGPGAVGGGTSAIHQTALFRVAPAIRSEAGHDGALSSV